MQDQSHILAGVFWLLLDTLFTSSLPVCPAQPGSTLGESQSLVLSLPELTLFQHSLHDSLHSLS